MNLDQALADPNLLGAGLGSDVSSWASWRAILRATYGLPLDDGQAEVFDHLAGGRRAPQSAVSEFWAVVGRRSGKSRMAAAMAVYEACFAGHEAKLAPGEVGIVAVVSASKWQAKAIHGYALGFLRSSPILAQMIRTAGAEEIALANRISIEIRSGNFRTARGRTLVCAVFDETAFWRSEESQNPDVETYRAVLPALATTGGKLIGISSPYRKAGLLYQKHRDHYGTDDDDVLVIQGRSLDLNSTLDPAIVERSRAADPEGAKAEWDGQFRDDISGFVTREAVDAITAADVLEIAPDHGRPRTALRDGVPAVRYSAFCDPSGGSADSMTLAIASRDDERAILHCVREVKPPFHPESVVREFADLLKHYRVNEVTGDRYAGEWVASAFARYGIHYRSSPKSKNEIYVDLLPMVNSRKAALLDNNRLITQLCNLERRTSRSGRDSIDHPPGAHDDLANAAAGALVFATRSRQGAVMQTYGVGLI